MNRSQASAGLSVAVVFWGASFIATKIALRELTPARVVFIRFTLGLIVLSVVMVLRHDFQSVSGEKFPTLTLLGFLGIAFHQWLQATGLKTVSSPVTAWIIATIPVFVAQLARLVRAVILRFGEYMDGLYLLVWCIECGRFNAGGGVSQSRTSGHSSVG